MYVEASKSGAYEGDVASLVKKNLKFTGSTCVTFWYHMYGVDIGSLEVYVGDKSYFSKSGDNGNQWKKAYLPIAEIGTFSVSIHFLSHCNINYFLYKTQFRI